MTKSMPLFVVVAMVALLLIPSSHAGVQVKADKDNVVASRLEGQWESDPEISRRLGGDGWGKIAFSSDPSVAQKVPPKYDEFLKGKQVYMAGVMSLNGIEHPFVLIEHKGHSHLLYFRERDGDPMGDGESFNLSIAVAKDTANDLLLIGGDSNNQPFTAYKRAK